jgi:uncharacterized membrane protein YheB (UPF0754 family)
MPLAPLLFLTPLITALIGWFTNWVAIKMLFHPRRPSRVFFWSWQGLMPRRQEQLAAEAAEIIEREILQQHLILSEIRKVNLEPHLERAGRDLVWQRIGPQLRSLPLLWAFVNDQLLARFEVIATTEIKKEASGLIERIAADFEGSFDLKLLIERNIAGFDLDRLERIVNEVARREFRSIERLGAVLGFIIGLLQLGLFWLGSSLPA